MMMNQKKKKIIIITIMIKMIGELNQRNPKNLIQKVK